MDVGKGIKDIFKVLEGENGTNICGKMALNSVGNAPAMVVLEYPIIAPVREEIAYEQEFDTDGTIE